MLRVPFVLLLTFAFSAQTPYYPSAVLLSNLAFSLDRYVLIVPEVNSLILHTPPQGIFTTYFNVTRADGTQYNERFTSHIKKEDLKQSLFDMWDDKKVKRLLPTNMDYRTELNDYNSTAIFYSWKLHAEYTYICIVTFSNNITYPSYKDPIFSFGMKCLNTDFIVY